ncbi:hypothetical protein N431DRAFT_425107 [Stipitochalara longipes BDJ]|nr:hypothetical protein N431DRAFT_425107 [Stipitochalara longipes BDJ]
MAVDRGPELSAVLGLFLGLAYLFVLLRVYVKTFLSKSWGADDTLLLASLVSFTTYAACSLSGVHYGTGRHLEDILPKDIPRALYFWWLCELFYTITTVLIRLSIAVFLLRICIKPGQRWVIYGTLTMIISFSICYFFLVLFQCHPVSFFWRQYEGLDGSCINPAVVPNASIAHSVVSFTADWILGLLPIVLLWYLKMNTRTKVSVAGLLSLGLLAGIATMIRIPYIKVLAITDDFLFATTDVAIWSTVEPGLGLVAAGGATLRPLFRSFYNLSTNRRSVTHPYLPSHPQSRIKSHRSSPSSLCRQESIRLRNDIVDPRGTVTSVGSPFGDTYELGAEGGFGDRKRSGPMNIKVHRTVEISRVQESDEEEDDGSPGASGIGGSERDLI